MNNGKYNDLPYIKRKIVYSKIYSLLKVIINKLVDNYFNH